MFFCKLCTQTNHTPVTLYVRQTHSVEMGNVYELSTIAPIAFNNTTSTPHNDSTTAMYIPDELNFPPTFLNVFIPSIAVSLFIGLVGNLLAVFITYTCAKENHGHRLTVPAILVRALLATDLGASAFFLARGCLLFLYRDMWFQCNLDMTSNLIFSWVSGLVNMLMSCDRCLALGAPFFYHTHATLRKTYVALAISVLVAITVSFLPVMGFGSYNVYLMGENYCLAPGDIQARATMYDFHFNVLFFVLGLGITVVIYASNTVVLINLLKLKRRLVAVTDYGSVNSGVQMGGLNPSTAVARCASGSDHVQTEPHVASTGEFPLSSADNVSTIDLRDDPASTSRPGNLRAMSSVQRHTNSGKIEMRFATMILVFSLVFSISWLPFYVSNLVLKYRV